MNAFRYGVPGFALAVVVLGVLGDALFRPGPTGINVTLYWVITLGVFAYQVRARAIVLPVPARLLLAIATLFSVLYIWRDVSPTHLLLLAVIGIAIILAAAARIGRDPRLARVADYALDALNFGIWALRLPFVLMSQTQQAVKSAGESASATVFAVLRGLLLAAPIVIIFGALLISADAMYEQFITNTLDFDIANVVSHVMLFAVCAWAASAVLWQCLEGPVGKPVYADAAQSNFRWGAIEINVALAVVTALFLSFIAVQLRYLFGGHEHVITEAGLTYADYARRGFFELATVDAISLAILITCSRLVDTAGPRGKRAYKIIAACFIASVLALVASALHRMNLYIDAYGLTRLRLYTAVFMGWMVLVFAWLYLTILQEHIHRFAWGLVLSGYAATFFLLAVNPDAAIARVNMARAAEGKDIDIDYLLLLSADAIPPVVRALPALPESRQRQVRSFLNDYAQRLQDREPRTWNIGLARAQRALHSLTGPSPLADTQGVAANEN